MKRIKILFLCTGNSCRSQMAEGWARHLKSGVIDAYSAGIEKHGLNPLAVRAMAEAGIDITGQTSKTVGELAEKNFDYVVTVCGHAHETCPIFPGGAKVVHVGFDDPPKLAAGVRSDDEALTHYRRVRDEIRAFVEALPASLGPDKEGVDDPRGIVRREYGKIARQGGSCCGSSSTSCGGSSADAVATAVGYSGEELAGLPDGANMGLSCGNPTAIASLRPGEVVLDLGAGGGFDVFVAAHKLGPSGRAIGVDMTPDMVEKARRNAESFRKSSGLNNVEFRLGEIEHLPVADSSVDVVISNCVINLSPDKARVWREVARVLKPGGRVSVSDLALLRPLPDAVRESVTALVGCIAGAVLVDETREMVRVAGLIDAEFTSRSDYIDSMAGWSDPLYSEIVSKLPPDTKPSDFVTSLSITANKPKLTHERMPG